MTTFDPAIAAQHLLAARAGSPAVPFRDVLPADRAGAYAVQDATVKSMGPTAGWKVGAKNISAEPTCAPIPSSCLLMDGVHLEGAAWQMRGIEVEIAVRLGRDLNPFDAHMPIADIAAAIDAVLPAIEVVETRLAEGRAADPLAQLADLQSHGALVLGAPSSLRAADIDFRKVRARITFSGLPVAVTQGGNPAEDVWRLLGWLAFHCVQRGTPLRAGQVVTTGSFTGLLFAAQGTQVLGEIEGAGAMSLRF